MPLSELNINILSAAPEIGLSILAIFILIFDFFIQKKDKAVVGYASIIGLLLLLPVAFITIHREPAFGGMLISDSYSAFFNVIFIVASIFTIFLSQDYLRRMDSRRGEYYHIVLFAVLGMMVMAASNDLLSIYVGLELMALSFYILVGMRFKSTRSAEGALKYFVLGALSSGILLYGISFVYGISGTTNLGEIAISLKGITAANPFLLLGIGMVVVGLGFKVALFPFHVWAPDTYEGAPTPVTALLSIGSKSAAFAVFLRVFIVAFPNFQPEWSGILWLLSAATMIFGSVVAISQRNIIRMLAYSSIAHAGIILIGLLTYTTTSLAGTMYYLFVYLFMNMGAFAVVILLMEKDGRWENIPDYRGLAMRSPLTASLLALFLLSLAGVPPTGGFVAKFYIFLGAIKAHYYWLAVIGVISTAISLYFYVRVIFYMVMKDAGGIVQIPSRSIDYDIVLFCTAFGSIFLGIYSGPFINMAVKAIETLMI